jgi:hypothetical protein
MMGITEVTGTLLPSRCPSDYLDRKSISLFAWQHLSRGFPRWSCRLGIKGNPILTRIPMCRRAVLLSAGVGRINHGIAAYSEKSSLFLIESRFKLHWYSVELRWK